MLAGSIVVHMSADAEGWGELSTELWACIFSLLKLDLTTVIVACDMEDLALEEQEQAQFHALRTVCKQMKAAFVQHQHLHSDLLLGSRFHQTHLPKLLEWIYTNGASVHNLVATCGSPALDTVLSCLHMQRSCLNAVSLSNINTATLLLLHRFDFITSCQLQPPTGQTLSLQALSALPQLTSLNLLRGQYTHLNAAERLTALLLNDCQASCHLDAQAVTSLQNVELCNATILRFHEHGLSACVHLRCLWCKHAFIEARRHAEDFAFDSSGAFMSENLSTLTALSEMTIKSDYRLQQLRFDLLGHLASLSHLCLVCPADLIQLPKCVGV